MAITLQGAFLPGSMAANPAAERRERDRTHGGRQQTWRSNQLRELLSCKHACGSAQCCSNTLWPPSRTQQAIAPCRHLKCLVAPKVPANWAPAAVAWHLDRRSICGLLSPAIQSCYIPGGDLVGSGNSEDVGTVEAYGPGREG